MSCTWTLALWRTYEFVALDHRRITEDMCFCRLSGHETDLRRASSDVVWAHCCHWRLFHTAERREFRWCKELGTSGVARDCAVVTERERASVTRSTWRVLVIIDTVSMISSSDEKHFAAIGSDYG